MSTSTEGLNLSKFAYVINKNNITMDTRINNILLQKMQKIRPVLKYVIFHAEFESKLRFA